MMKRGRKVQYKDADHKERRLKRAPQSWQFVEVEK